jgi:hypothetical protein
MKKFNSNILLVLMLIVSSSIIYLLQLVQFHSPRDTVFYFLQDMAFLPLQVAIVTFAFNRILNVRAKRERLKKMNMAIGAFFGEAGVDMVIKLLGFNTEIGKLKDNLEVIEEWESGDFQKAVKLIKGYDFAIDSRAGNLADLKELLIQKRYFLLTMLENPNLLEHDTFSDMLWAVFHLTDELVNRDGFTDLPDMDLNHLSIDIKRAFSTLLVEWVNYISHLKSDYPYLFSMAIRKNPFNEKSSVIIK